MSLGKRIEQLRKEHGLNMTELSKKVGISHVQISYYEKEVQKPSAEILARLSNALSTSSQYLLEGDKAHPLEILMPEVKALSLGDQDKIIVYVKDIILFSTTQSFIDEKRKVFSQLKTTAA